MSNVKKKTYESTMLHLADWYQAASTGVYKKIANIDLWEISENGTVIKVKFSDGKILGYHASFEESRKEALRRINSYLRQLRKGGNV